MLRYAFWNNKGGTGKTSLAFQAITEYARTHPESRILGIDACPQANFSELLLGSLVNRGSANLMELHEEIPRRTLGGYFQDRLPSPFAVGQMDYSRYICRPSQYNNSIPDNISLCAGDPLIELQANAMATLANAQIPGTNAWIEIVDWVSDFIELCKDDFDIAFIDANP